MRYVLHIFSFSADFVVIFAVYSLIKSNDSHLPKNIRCTLALLSLYRSAGDIFLLEDIHTMQQRVKYKNEVSNHLEEGSQFH